MLLLSPELAFCSNQRTARVPQLWSLLSMCARQQLRTCEGTLLKEDWKQSCTIKCSNADAELFPACRRLISLLSLAAHHHMDMTDFPVRHLAQKAVELVFVTNISPTTIHEMLKKTNSSRGNMNIGVCPRSEARRVAAMEDVLDLYEEPYDRKSPTVCLDEKPVVLHADVHLPVPVKAGQPERMDYEYERKGTRNLFVMVEPLAGWRHVEVTKQRTSAATTPRWFVGWLMRFIRTQSTFDWCRLTSILIRRLRCMRRFRQVKLAAFCNAWSFITRGIHDEGRDEATLRQRVRAVEKERTAQHRGISWQFTRARCTMQT
jgi:hypothetical protein